MSSPVLPLRRKRASTRLRAKHTTARPVKLGDSASFSQPPGVWGSPESSSVSRNGVKRAFILVTYTSYIIKIYIYISKISDATLQLGKPFIEQQLFSDDIHPDIHTASNPQRHSASAWIAPLFALLNLFGNRHKITQLRRE